MNRGLTLVSAACLVALGVSAVALAEDRPEFDLQGLERRLDQLRRKEHSLRAALEKDEGEMEALRRRLIARGRAYYRLSRSSPSGELLDYAVQLDRLRQALLSDLSRLQKLEEQRARAGRGLTLIEDRKAPLEVERQAAGRARDALLSTQERERAFQLAFSNSRGASDHTAVYSATGALDAVADSFEDMLGELPFPLPGRAEVQRVKKDFADGPGLIMKAAPGAPVRSVYSGRVGFADPYPNYGKTVILDHGDGYFTVTSGLADIEVRVGDELPAGTRLGTASTRAGVGEIYFEIRYQRDTLDPREWFGI